jgi:cytochrome c-type biogenesis protein CcmE
MMGRMGGRIVLVVAILLIGAGFGYLLYGGIGENLVWNLTPDELLAKGDAAYDHSVRLGGQVSPGSVVWDEDRMGVQFRMHDVDGAEVLVHSAGIPTAMFREGIGVVVEGKLTRGEGTPIFHATNLMVKHSNEYRPPSEGHPTGRDMNSTLLPE